MPATNRQPEPPDESSDRPTMSKSQKRLLIVVGAVLLLALIGWLIDTLAPIPKKAGAGLPQTSVVVVSGASSHAVGLWY